MIIKSVEIENFAHLKMRHLLLANVSRRFQGEMRRKRLLYWE